jgi:hypothetical protein
LSRQYHGLELVDWSVEKLSADIFVMLQNWDKPTILGHCIRDAYELLQMETGLEGNIFLLESPTRSEMKEGQSLSSRAQGGVLCAPKNKKNEVL